jgi:3-oxoacyl-[acyl-carrier protein] reductase
MTGTEALLLAGRTALITGSSRNLGLGIAALMAARGARVVLHASSASAELENAAKGIRDAGGDAVSVQANLETEAGVDKLVQSVRDNVGDVDILVNNAAIRPRGEIESLDLAEWRRVLAVNLEAPFMLCRSFVPGMVSRHWGRIVNIAGVDAFWGKPDKPHVVAANMGKIGLARSLSVRYGGSGITANAVVAGTMATTRTQSRADYPELETRFSTLLNRVPMGRPGKVSEFAEVVAFLASPAGSYVTGQTLHVNGGSFPTTSDAMTDATATPEGVREFVETALGQASGDYA